MISTRSKSGTTWVQMICALLILQSPDLWRPLPELSPWLDWLVLPKEELFADLEDQTHRRFIETHARAGHDNVIVVGHSMGAEVGSMLAFSSFDRRRHAW